MAGTLQGVQTHEDTDYVSLASTTLQVAERGLIQVVLLRCNEELGILQEQR